VIGAASPIGETVYVANLDTTETYAFDAANGERLWTFRDGAYNPVISDGNRLYLTGYKMIYSLKAGKPKKPGKGKKQKGGSGKKSSSEKQGGGEKQPPS
jgi:outer membrane protein assembly factor BamB